MNHAIAEAMEDVHEGRTYGDEKFLAKMQERWPRKLPRNLRGERVERHRRNRRLLTDRDEPERGEQYAHDLPTEAIRQLGDPGRARAGRHLLHTSYPDRQELPVFPHHIASFTS